MMLTYLKHLFIKSIKQTLFAFIIILLSPPEIHAQNTTRNVYVWDFKTNQPDIKKFATKLTDDFETELVKLDQYTVLQRRNHNLVLAHQDMENAISSVKTLPVDAVNKLKTIRAESVIFGQLLADEDSGIYEVTVFFQNLDSGEIPKKESILIEKALLKSNTHRKQYMKDLMDKLHAKEILAAKHAQFEIISEKLDKYFVRVKDVQIAFRDILDIALKSEEYFKELENTINNYNTIFIDLNDNGEKYILNFESVWGKSHGKDLEAVYNGIMNDIHKKHILKLNDVRQKIWAYRDSNLNKRERENMKEDIERHTKNATLGLTADIDKVEDDMERLSFALKNDMRREQ